jgi:hypothetical protein
MRRKCGSTGFSGITVNLAKVPEVIDCFSIKPLQGFPVQSRRAKNVKSSAASSRIFTFALDHHYYCYLVVISQQVVLRSCHVNAVLLTSTYTYRQGLTMNTHKAENVERWCSCVRRRVEHKHLGLQDFGWAVMDAYQCTRCHTVKYFLFHEGCSLANGAEARRGCEPVRAPDTSALKPHLNSA